MIVVELDGATLDVIKPKIADVAPTVLHLLGLPVREGMGGAVAAAALVDEYLEARPIRTDGDPLTSDRAAIVKAGQSRQAGDDAPQGLSYQ
jgi:hypothetical protein